MGISPYIDKLVAREKRQRLSFRDSTLDRIIEWHEKRVDEHLSSIAAIQCENPKSRKSRAAMQMHEITITYLKRIRQRQ